MFLYNANVLMFIKLIIHPLFINLSYSHHLICFIRFKQIIYINYNRKYIKLKSSKEDTIYKLLYFIFHSSFNYNFIAGEI
ncbi:hypothetical protein Hanom_Chr17g01561591 [Helianthus anomalus]